MLELAKDVEKGIRERNRVKVREIKVDNLCQLYYSRRLNSNTAKDVTGILVTLILAKKIIMCEAISSIIIALHVDLEEGMVIIQSRTVERIE